MGVFGLSVASPDFVTMTLVKKLDYETKTEYNLTLRATNIDELALKGILNRLLHPVAQYM